MRVIPHRKSRQRKSSRSCSFFIIFCSLFQVLHFLPRNSHNKRLNCLNLHQSLRLYWRSFQLLSPFAVIILVLDLRNLVVNGGWWGRKPGKNGGPADEAAGSSGLQFGARWGGVVAGDSAEGGRRQANHWESLQELPAGIARSQG